MMDLFILESGRITGRMAMALRGGQMVPSTKATTKKVSSTATGSFLGSTIQGSRSHFPKTLSAVSAPISGLMGEFMRAIEKIIRWMEGGSLRGLTGGNTTVSTRKI